MGSNDHEVGDARAVEAQDRRIPLPTAWVQAAMADNWFTLAEAMTKLSSEQAHEMARAAAEQAANDDSGSV